jgi:hypothetical protein
MGGYGMGGVQWLGDGEKGVGVVKISLLGKSY